MYYPRVRARSIVASVRSWPKVDLASPRLLAFAGYKAGVTHAVVVESRPGSPLFGREIAKVVTVVDAPPLIVCGFRAYVDTEDGLKTLSEVWATNLPKDLDRALTVPKNYDPSPALKSIEANMEKISEFRAIVSTQPRKSGLRKKTPEVFEVKVGGEVKAAFEYLKGILGKEVRARDVFGEGQVVDVISVTKGKGFQGPVKRFGVKILPRWHKHRKGHRVVGAISPSAPSMMFTVPRPGQMGFHQRTEYNKLILKIGDDGKEITPDSGFHKYGIIRTNYIVIDGTVPGPVKRLIKIRFPMRPPKKVPSGPPKVVRINM